MTKDEKREAIEMLHRHIKAADELSGAFVDADLIGVASDTARDAELCEMIISQLELKG